MYPAKKYVVDVEITRHYRASMIQQVTGDILLSNAQAVAHGIAPNDHFDSGLALSLRQDWPALYKDIYTTRQPPLRVATAGIDRPPPSEGRAGPGKRVLLFKIVYKAGDPAESHG